MSSRILNWDSCFNKGFELVQLASWGYCFILESCILFICSYVACFVSDVFIFGALLFMWIGSLAGCVGICQCHFLLGIMLGFA